MALPLITLTTDFGERDPYVAAMKGVVLSRMAGAARPASILDLTHDIGAQGVLEGALFLAGAVPWFPPGSIHVAVVDPGVGTDRRAIAVTAGGHCLIGPDNGLFTLVLDKLGLEETRLIENPDCMAARISPTFHGRDIFVLTAGWLAAGNPFASIGPVVDNLASLDVPAPRQTDTGVTGAVLHVDRFGNVLTNIPQTLLPPDGQVTVRAGPAELSPLQRTYGDAPQGAGLILISSAGYLEIAVHCGDAAKAYGLSPGDAVEARRHS